MPARSSTSSALPGFFVIESGEADVRRGDEVIASVGAGDVIGEMGLLVTGTRTASIVATTPMTLVAMFTREFRRIEAGSGDRRAAGFAAIAERLRATESSRARGAHAGH